jgi:adenylate cyclase
MIFDTLVLPNQAMLPLDIVLLHLVLCLYITFRRRGGYDASSRFFIAYLLLTALWNATLAVIAVGDVSMELPGFTWTQLASYGLIVLGVTYWAFVRASLQRSWAAPLGWLIGLIGLALAVGLDMGWLLLPTEALAWSAGRLGAENISSVLSNAWWILFTGLTFITILAQRIRTTSPAHKNRLQYLFIATTLLAAGYGMFLFLWGPFGMVGLIITCLGSGLAAYIVAIEDLPDLETSLRRATSTLVVVLVTVAVYLAGIYLVQISLGDFLASTFLSRFFDPVFLSAAVTAVLLTVVYTPIRRVSRRLTNRILFGQHYDYQAVIHDYSQAISNILYLDELADVALTHIKQALKIDEGLLLMLDTESDEHLHFRILPLSDNERCPETLPLTKETPLVRRLVDESQPLAQYTIDISPQFKPVPSQERSALKELNCEWFVPILKKGQLVGLFALGPKKSKQRYSTEDLRLLTTLADQTALALENATLVDHLQRNLEEITRMKNLMDNVFDSMVDGVITTDTVGRITLFNKAAEVILALPDGCTGAPYTIVLPALTKTALPDLIDNVLSREGRITDYEIVSELPERGEVNLNVNLAPLKDAQDQTRGVTLVMDDTTETKRLRAVQDMFRRYVSPAVVDRLPSDPSELSLGGQRQEITVLFADIRGFTTFSEHMEPEQLVEALNEYLSMAAASILMCEGTLDKFMGDAVMGIFNAPLKQEDHVMRAVRAASTMQRVIADYHHNLGEERCLSFGVGLHVGDAVVGNVGLPDRMDYTAIGDAVNLAKRIQENTPAGKVLMSEAVYEVVKGSVEAVFYDELRVKGREQPVVTYELVSRFK